MYVFPFISIFKTEEMMKKLLCTMFALFAFSLGASANEADDVMKVFDEYVKDANITGYINIRQKVHLDF